MSEKKAKELLLLAADAPPLFDRFVKLLNVVPKRVFFSLVKKIISYATPFFNIRKGESMCER